MTYYIDISDFGDNILDKAKLVKDKLILSDDFKNNNPSSLYARVFLCYLLQLNFGIDSFSISCGENGKPHLNIKDLFFNFSHSGKYILCSIDAEEIGCDVQVHGEYNRKVAKRFYTADEYSFLEKSSESDKFFIKLWTMKESILKRTGLGISGGLSEYDFSSYVEKNEFSAYGSKFSCFSFDDAEVTVCSSEGCEKLIKVSENDFIKFLDSFI